MKLFNLLKRKPFSRRVFVIGLDCAAPQLVFERWRTDLPNLVGLAEQGLWGELQSSTPAITVPAWSSMLSSKDPGVLGFYGFRNRTDHSYDKMFIATASAVKEKRVWNYLSEMGKQSVVIGVPQTFPVKPLNGYLISGFLTPGIKNKFTYPDSFKAELLSVVPDYEFDVANFRTEDKDWLLDQIYSMTEKHFAAVDYALATKPWDFFMVMEIGVDRIHHGFWQYHDPNHFRFRPGNPYENAIHDYYVYLDRKIGEWLTKIGNDTVVLVVSDHGAKRMDGGICINEWLWRNDYLAFKKEPKPGEKISFEKMKVDWSRTKAWGSGGYYGRVFLNVKDREPAGVIPATEYDRVRSELIDKLVAIPDPDGRSIGTKVFRPQEIYRRVNGVAPDLIVYFGDLHWRSVGSLGYEDWYTFDNDTGPDDCNHAENGLVILFDPANGHESRQVKNAQLMDVAPTILSFLGCAIPDEMQGTILTKR